MTSSQMRCRKGNFPTSICYGGTPPEDVMNMQRPVTEPTTTHANEAMLMMIERERQRFRPVIYIGPVEEPTNAVQLTMGTWHTKLRSAQQEGLRIYFRAYEQRYGFKHPEDPHRPPGQAVPPGHVVVAGKFDEEPRAYTQAEVSNVAG